MPRSCPPHLPARIFSNIDEDSNSADDLRDDAIQELRTAANAGELPAAYEAFREKARAAGRLANAPVAFEVNERVGRLRYRDNYATEISEMLSRDPSLGVIDDSDLEELISWLFGDPADIEDDAANLLFELLLADRPIEAFVGWYFRGPLHGNKPYEGCKLDCLPWRLGLPNIRSGSRYAAFEMAADSVVTPMIATFCDVPWPYQEFWRPNGRTEPRADSPAGCEPEGLEEFLGGAPRFRSIRVPVQTISAE